MKANSILLSAMLLLVGCKNELTPEEYKKELVENRNWSKSTEIDGYTFKVDYIPANWIAYINSSGGNKTQDAYQKNLDEANGMYYFRIGIDAGKGKNVLKRELEKEEEYFDRLYYVSYRMKDDLKLISGDKTYPCELYVYERAYDLSSKLSIMAGFKKPIDENEDVRLELYPAVLGTGKVKFEFKGTKIASAPKLVFE